MSETTAETGVFARRLQWLYDHHVDPVTQKKFSDQRLANRIMEMTGYEVTHSALWALRKGVRDNPTWGLVQSIARVFGVSADFFRPEFPEPGEEHDTAKATLAAALERNGVQAMLLRASTLSDDGLKALASIIDQAVQVARSLPPSNEPTTRD